MRRAMIVLVLLPNLATAETAMPAGAFDAATLGKTMTWIEFGQDYGTEEYLPGRRVRWQFTADLCREGIWYQNGAAICFVYGDSDETPACWLNTQNGDKFLALDTDGSPDSPPVVIEAVPEPLSCLGPQVGV